MGKARIEPRFAALEADPLPLGKRGSMACSKSYALCAGGLGINMGPE